MIENQNLVCTAGDDHSDFTDFTGQPKVPQDFVVVYDRASCDHLSDPSLASIGEHFVK